MPDIWSEIDVILEPKDYINFCLTNAFASDRISLNASRSFFDAIKEDQVSSDALGIDDSVLPKALSPFDVVGKVQDDVPKALQDLVGAPVYCGSTDTWTCVLGSGGLKAGAAYGISGTTDVFGLILPEARQCKGLMTVQWGPRQWQLGGPSQGAASRLTWAAELYAPGKTVEQALEESFSSGEHMPIFLPYLEGERTPFWDADLRGAFLGLNADHKADDFIRSVAEGINFVSRIILEKGEAAAGVQMAHICFSGGLSNNPVLCQLKADILHRPVFVPETKESGLVGAASMVFATSEDIPEITSQLMKRGKWYRPDPGTRTFFDDRYAVFKQANDAVSPISHQISQLTHAQ